MLARLRSLIRNLFQREQVERELDAELNSFVEEQALRKMAQAQGLSHDEAMRQAQAEAGGMTQVKEQVRGARTGAWLETFWNDLRHGARGLRKSPGFTAIAMITLALGIGANAAIFSFVNAVLLKPLPYPHPEQIVSVWEKRPDGGSNIVSTLNFLDWQKQNRCFQFLSAVTLGTVTLTGSGNPEELNVHRVSASYFTLLGVGATLGRTFAENEDEVGNDREVVLSNRIWRSRFGGDPKVIGREITLDAKNYTIIGVLPANSEFDRSWGAMWLPLAFTPADMTRNYHWLDGPGDLGRRRGIARGRGSPGLLFSRPARDEGGPPDDFAL